MNFRTEYKAQPSATPISLHNPILMLGSCFSNNIGARLRERMVNVDINPTGILFNPQSIANVVEAALNEKPAVYENHDGIWNCWLLPSEFSSADEDDAHLRGKRALTQLRTSLLRAGTIIITLGSSIIYTLARPPYMVVSNCHKRPASTFFRDMLPVEAVASACDKMIALIRRHNPRARFIFTVSPVRHLKEGFHANTLSKASLQLALAHVTAVNPDTEYFPAYEIMNDDLRDYRFFGPDMQHPSPLAADYIYEKFAETYFDETSRELLTQALKLRRRTEHRHLHPESREAAKFNEQTTRLIDELKTKAPFLSVD